MGLGKPSSAYLYVAVDSTKAALRLTLALGIRRNKPGDTQRVVLYMDPVVRKNRILLFALSAGVHG